MHRFLYIFKKVTTYGQTYGISIGWIRWNKDKLYQDFVKGYFVGRFM